MADNPDAKIARLVKSRVWAAYIAVTLTPLIECGLIYFLWTTRPVELLQLISVLGVCEMVIFGLVLLLLIYCATIRLLTKWPKGKYLAVALIVGWLLIILCGVGYITGNIPSVLDPQETILQCGGILNPSYGHVWLYEAGFRSMDTYVRIKLTQQDFEAIRNDLGEKVTTVGDWFEAGPWWCCPTMDSDMVAYQAQGWMFTYLYVPKTETMYIRCFNHP